MSTSNKGTPSPIIAKKVVFKFELNINGKNIAKLESTLSNAYLT